MRIALIVLAVIIIIFLVPRLISGSRAAAPTPGSIAPDFSLPSQQGAPVSLKDYRGNWIVLYFYPKDQTPGCTREAHNFQADQSKYAERHAVVLGVSVDSVDSFLNRSRRQSCQNVHERRSRKTQRRGPSRTRSTAEAIGGSRRFDEIS